MNSRTIELRRKIIEAEDLVSCAKTSTLMILNDAIVDELEKRME